MDGDGGMNFSEEVAYSIKTILDSTEKLEKKRIHYHAIVSALCGVLAEYIAVQPDPDSAKKIAIELIENCMGVRL